MRSNVGSMRRYRAQFYAVSRKNHRSASSGINGIRVDTAVYSGCEVLPYYDSMLAKLIVHGKTVERR